MITKRRPRNAEDPTPPDHDDAPGAETPETPEQAATSAKQVRSIEATTPAAVNLLSPWVLDELRVVGLRKRFIAGGIALVLALALIWTGLTLRLHQSEDEVSGEEQVANALSRQISDLSDVRGYIDTVNNRAITAAAMVDAQAQMARAMETLAAALPRRARFDTLTLVLATEEPAAAENATTEAPCPGPDPFGATTVIGCVQLSGTADSRADVSKFVQDLAASPLFVEPFVETTTKGAERGVTFTGSVGLTPQARHGGVTDADTSEEGS